MQVKRAAAPYPLHPECKGRARALQPLREGRGRFAPVGRRPRARRLPSAGRGG